MQITYENDLNATCHIRKGDETDHYIYQKKLFFEKTRLATPGGTIYEKYVKELCEKYGFTYKKNRLFKYEDKKSDDYTTEKHIFKHYDTSFDIVCLTKAMGGDFYARIVNQPEIDKMATNLINTILGAIAYLMNNKREKYMQYDYGLQIGNAKIDVIEYSGDYRGVYRSGYQYHDYGKENLSEFSEYCGMLLALSDRIDKILTEYNDEHILIQSVSVCALLPIKDFTLEGIELKYRFKVENKEVKEYSQW